MKKDFIKSKLRENLFDRIKEAGTNTEDPTASAMAHPRKDKDSNKSDAKNDDEESRSTKKDYGDIQNYFKKPLHFSQVDVMKAMGIDDDEDGVNRSYFGKQLHQDRNPEGGLYQFDDEELDRVRSAIKNKK